MSDDDVEQFETADSGASTTYPMQAGNVRKGGFMVIKGGLIISDMKIVLPVMQDIGKWA